MSRTFNLWILNHYSGSPDLGMEYRHFFLARQLARRGHTVALIAASYHHLTSQRPRASACVTFDSSQGIEQAWIRTPAYQGNGMSRLLNMVVYSWRVARHRKVLEDRLGAPDVVLGSSPHPFVTLNLLALKRRYRVPILFEVRDLWPQMLIELGSINRHHPLSYLFRYLENIGYSNADRVLSLWHSADRYMFQHGLTEDRFVYLPNGVETSSPGEVDEDVRGHPLLQRVRSRRAAGKFLIGYGGSHGLANPLDCVVDTCVLLRERGIDHVEFFLVGDGPAKQRITARAAEMELDNLHFHDYVSRDVILEFYRNIDVAYMGLRDLPLFKYGPTPNKLMDYLTTAKPIIFAVRSSFNPVKEANAGLTIQPGRADLLAEAAIQLSNASSSELRAMGEAGRTYAVENLEYSRLAERLERVIGECLATEQC